MKRPPFKLKPEHALPLILVAMVLSLTFIMSLRSKLRKPPAAPAVASAPQSASDAAKDYSWVQNTPQDDILNARRAAKEQVGASDIAAWENTPPPTDYPTPPAPPQAQPQKNPPQPKNSEPQKHRLAHSFSQQSQDSQTISLSNQELRVELARSRPSETACIALDRSFDTLAPTLGCR